MSNEGKALISNEERKELDARKPCQMVEFSQSGEPRVPAWRELLGQTALDKQMQAARFTWPRRLPISSRFLSLHMADYS